MAALIPVYSRHVEEDAEPDVSPDDRRREVDPDAPDSVLHEFVNDHAHPLMARMVREAQR